MWNTAGTMSVSPVSNIPDFLRGAIAPLFTPFDAQGRLDLAAIPSLLQWLYRGGARSVFARSGMGRMHTFTVAETKALAEAVMRAERGGMGVLLGCSGEWLGRARGERPDPDHYVEQAAELTRFAAKIGADASVHVVPAALLPRQGETAQEVVLRYFREMDRVTRLPIVIYQPPGLPEEYRLTPQLLTALRRLPSVRGLKLSTQDPAVFGPIAEVSRDGFALICGHEGYYLNGLEQGACGVIGQGSMVYPRILRAVAERFEVGDMQGAHRAQEDVARALKVSDGLNSVVVMKQYMARKGVRVQPFDREGPTPYPDSVVDRVERELDAILAAYPQPKV